MSLPRVEFEIVQGEAEWGKFVVELNEDVAPKTVENFLKYIDKGFYDGTIFHRVHPRFMIQAGGCPAPNEEKKPLFDGVENEAEATFKAGLKNVVGTLSMARTNDPHSGTSHFFINTNDNAELDYPGRDGWGYCVFGRVVEGLEEVVFKIRDTKTKPDKVTGESAMPVDPPTIKAARKVEA